MGDLNVFTRGQFGVHRQGIAAADSAPPLSSKPRAAGIDTRGNKGIVVDFVLASGTLGTFTAELLYWDPENSQFVSAISTGDTVTSTKPGQWKVLDTADRIVFVAITTLSGGSSPVLDILCQPIPREGQNE